MTGSFRWGSLAQLAEFARQLRFSRTLLVADKGMVAAGYAKRAADGIEAFLFDEFGENPDTVMVEEGRRFAAPLGIDSIIGLGGGSSMDCAKAINFVLTNGGSMKDYWGYTDPPKPMLPMIGVPTTTGTGSEAQSYTLISDAETRVKMACGAPGAMFKLVILDPELALSQPPKVLAAAGYDAVSHAVETFVTSKRNTTSDRFSLEAWGLISANFEKLLRAPGDIEAAAAMQMGAYSAGAAIEASMLGAAHACANPLTARYGTIHGVAIAVMLGHVVRWNSPLESARYRELDADLETRLEEMASAAGLPRTLRELGVEESALPALADEASKQWTGRFNPRPFDAAAALEIYRCAF